MSRFDRIKDKLSKDLIMKTGFWEDTLPLINQGAVIPIISNSFRIEQIFRDEKDVTGQIPAAPAYDDEDLTYDEQLTKVWAEFIDYPMPDSHNMARVAQYFLVEQKDVGQAKAKYLEFIKTFFLEIAGSDAENEDLARKLKSQVKEIHFSEIISQMDYPRFHDDAKDSLRLLARLPLSIYVTTSYYDFLERALEAEGKKPRTQACFWCGGISGAKIERAPDPDFKPTATEPIVYHLYGIEDYPQTLVLSEDDFMDFLVSIAEDTNMLKPIIPLKLQEALASSPLLLLGYHLRDWDFRILFRFILKYRNKDELTPRGMVIQLKPDEKRIGDIEKSIEYLSRYFDKKKFEVELANTDNLIYKLWEEINPDEKHTENIEKSVEYLSHYFDKKKFDVEWMNTDNFIFKLWDEWTKYNRQGQT